MTRSGAMMLTFVVGVAVGYQLPALRERWRRFLHARTFKPVLLHPFQPAPRQKQQ